MAEIKESLEARIAKSRQICEQIADSPYELIRYQTDTQKYAPYSSADIKPIAYAIMWSLEPKLMRTIQRYSHKSHFTAAMQQEIDDANQKINWCENFVQSVISNIENDPRWKPKDDLCFIWFNQMFRSVKTYLHLYEKYIAFSKQVLLSLGAGQNNHGLYPPIKEHWISHVIDELLFNTSEKNSLITALKRRKDVESLAKEQDCSVKQWIYTAFSFGVLPEELESFLDRFGNQFDFRTTLAMLEQQIPLDRLEKMAAEYQALINKHYAHCNTLSLPLKPLVTFIKCLPIAYLDVRDLPGMVCIPIWANFLQFGISPSFIEQIFNNPNLLKKVQRLKPLDNFRRPLHYMPPVHGGDIPYFGEDIYSVIDLLETDFSPDEIMSWNEAQLATAIFYCKHSNMSKVFISKFLTMFPDPTQDYGHGKEAPKASDHASGPNAFIDPGPNKPLLVHSPQAVAVSCAVPANVPVSVSLTAGNTTIVSAAQR